MNFLRKTKFLLLALLLTSSISLGYSSVALADSKADVCAGVSLTGSACPGNGDSTVTKIVKAAIQILTLIAGIAAVIMIIVAGLRFITSGGDSSGISGAKSALVYALVGLVVVALSQLIVHFVLGKV